MTLIALIVARQAESPATASQPVIEEMIERLYNLHVGVVGTGDGRRHERPHKPVLLLAALDLIADGTATAEHIPWSTALRNRFAQYFAVVQRNDDRNTPENPSKVHGQGHE